jgi:cell wall assembly regulator SMI1
MSLRALFPGGRFAAGASADQIRRAEEVLKVRLPDQLRALYLECDGFREPKGNAKYLFSLMEEDFIGSLVSVTQFWWQEWKQVAPAHMRIDFTPYVFFGSSSADEVWGVAWNRPVQIIAYHHLMEGTFEIAGTDILDVYRRDYSSYEGLD